ncbi:hypothetical protein MNBD_CHLOROFLEXI01-1372 [hydrothermal vent metagenome]|uniref:Lipoprotein n=1 Tax=hydrothermal vent metagenome TaxID=652676 RepID=A0A3B0VIM6_9ZZZZ
MKNPLFILFFLAIMFGVVACEGGSSGNEPPSDPADLQSYHLAEVCKGTAVEVAAEFDNNSSNLHPIVIFQQNTFEEQFYNLLFPSQTNLPAEWTIDTEGDYSTIELVGCLVRTETKLVDTCEGYELDETDEEGTVELYDATYELTIYAPQTGEVVGSETVETFMDECPSFVMFSTGDGEDLVEEWYGNPKDELANLVESYVNP